MENIKAVKEVLDNMDVLKQIEKRIFLYSIPDEVKPDSNITDILLEESESQPANYGDSEFKDYSESIDVSIFYAIKLPMKMTKLEILLQQCLMVNGFYIQKSNAHYFDPDTKQAIKTLTITRTQDLEQLL
ncbi:DUF806 family protein [Weissella viridescens]|uniref:DUF806 family protein n=1 Tax=Weissella viridescens TaxID=1629 RepID=UPI003AF283D9